MSSNTIVQCKSCPWRVDSDTADIPNYIPELHHRLRRTIKSGLESLPGSCLNVMACHHSRTGSEHACAGWLHNQLGVGNNIAVRIAVMTGTMPVPEVDGEQHDSFDGTLPKQKKRRRRR